MVDLLLIEWVTKMKLGSNSVEDHPQLSHNRHPVDGALVGAGSLWPKGHAPRALPYTQMAPNPPSTPVIRAVFWNS
jgi:hypothetical protein